MLATSSYREPGGLLLPRHLVLLSGALTGLSERTRDGLARLLAGAAADLVRDAVCTALAVPPDRLAAEPRRGPWAPVGGADSFLDELRGLDPEDRAYLAAEWDDFLPRPPARSPRAPEPPAVDGWGRPDGVALGLRAAAWWLGRRPGRSGLLTAAAIGAAATAAGLTGGPLALVGLELAESLLGLAGQRLAARAAQTLGRTSRP